MTCLLVLQQINCNGPSNLVLTNPSALDQAYTTQCGHPTTYKYFYKKANLKVEFDEKFLETILTTKVKFTA
jgi:hypothetical protein